MKSLTTRVLGVFLAAVLAFSMASCGSSNNGAPAPTQAATEAPAAAPAQAATEAAAEPAPAAEAPTPLSILTRSMICLEDYETNTFTKKLEADLNLDLSFKTVPDGPEMAEKVQLLLAAGDIPDILMTLGLNNNVLTKYGVGEGLFLPLDDLIASHAPNLNRIISGYQGGLDLLRMQDGKIYAMPNFENCVHCEHFFKMWVFQPWLDALGLSMPTTTDEFRDMLLAFKEKDPNGNGIADEIPLTGCDSGGWADNIEAFLLNAFTYYDRNKQGFYVEDGVVKNALISDEYKEGLKYLNQLYKDGLIYENAMTQDISSLTAQTENADVNITGAVPGGFVGQFAHLGGERANSYRPVTPLKGPKGYQNSPTYPTYPDFSSYAGFIINADCKYPEKAVELADYMYNTEITLDIRAGGMKDDFWVFPDASEGLLGFDGQPAVYKALKPYQNQNPQNESWLQVGVWDTASNQARQAIDTSVDLWTAEGNEYMLYKVTVEQYTPYARNYAIPPLLYDEEVSADIATLSTDLTSLFESSQFNYIFGVNDIDSTWDAYVAQIKTYIDPYQKYTQEAYDRQYK
jgi:putative aldouronate transport system substrate-binding protein